jgi:hypothetical protein
MRRRDATAKLAVASLTAANAAMGRGDATAKFAVASFTADTEAVCAHAANAAMGRGDATANLAVASFTAATGRGERPQPERSSPRSRKVCESSDPPKTTPRTEVSLRRSSRTTP